MISAKKFLGKDVDIVVDHTLGSKNQELGFIYPLNYGFLASVINSDGREFDAYIVGVFEPVVSFTGTCIAYLERLEDKKQVLVVAPLNKIYTGQQIRALTEFQEWHHRSKLVMAHNNL